jgi:thiamine pyrophosphate-dependent acetolactate synthase large subunit-like protein
MATDHRRNHIDWVHTALVQGNLVRDFVKWDDQPYSVAAIMDSMLRGYRIAMTEPSAPVYLCFDVDLQEEQISSPLTLPEPDRFQPPAPPGPNPDALQRAADLLAQAEQPVIVADAFGRHHDGIAALSDLAELLAAPVVSVGSRFSISSTHPLNLTGAKSEVLEQADVVLALDVFDLAGSLGPGLSARDRRENQFISRGTKLIHISLWDLLQRGLVNDYERLNPVDVPMVADTRVALPLLTDLCRKALSRDRASARRIEERRVSVERMRTTLEERRKNGQRSPQGNGIPLERLSSELWDVVKDMPWVFVNGGPRGGDWQITEPDQLAGGTRGAGLGHAAGAAVGGALAYRDQDRLCLNLIGDGDLLFTPSALWTAANAKVPLLTIVNNNRSYGNDESHQEFVARERGRPIENKGVGIFIEDPNTKFAKLAESFDVEGFGPVEDPNELRGVLERAAQIVLKERRPVLVDVLTQRRGMA